MTMYVPAPENETIRITNLYGEAMVQEEEPLLPDGKANPNAGTKKPATLEYWKFLLDRTLDPKLYGKREGLEALELKVLARKQINETRGKVGVHPFDNAVAEGLREAILSPTGGHLTRADIEHNLIDWALLWKPKLTDRPPAVLALPEEARAEPKGAES